MKLIFLINVLVMVMVCSSNIHLRVQSGNIEKNLAKINVGHQKLIDCATFDPKKIKLVTFDLFGALMDLMTSLTKSVSEILPNLTPAQVDQLIDEWEDAYGDHFGMVFNKSVTGDSPFQWVLRTSLDKIIAEMKIEVSPSQYEALIKAWGRLIPWPGTQEALEKLYKAGITLAALSNGDHNTLLTATSVFQPNVKFSKWFGSDFPVGSFKPDAAIYNNVLSGISANEHLHVAGASVDAWGARKAGMFSALLRSSRYPEQPYPCFLLRDVKDLPTLLGL